MTVVAPGSTRLVIAGATRDTAPFLPAVLANLDRLGAGFASVAYVIAENDSRDATKAILARWAAGKGTAAHVLNLDGVGREPVRTLRLEQVRNSLLEYIRADPTLRGFDLLCLVDMDDVLTRPIDAAAFAAAVRFLDETPTAGAVFANQIGAYYDMWALRHDRWCPRDIWHEVLAGVFSQGLSDEAAFAATFAPKTGQIPVDAPPLEVDSAFGGLGLYRLAAVVANPNPYVGSRIVSLPDRQGRQSLFRLQTCEHVHFHLGLRRRGHRLFILPGLINRDCTGFGWPPEAYRSFVIDGPRRALFPPDTA